MRVVSCSFNGVLEGRISLIMVERGTASRSFLELTREILRHRPRELISDEHLYHVVRILFVAQQNRYLTQN